MICLELGLLRNMDKIFPSNPKLLVPGPASLYFLPTGFKDGETALIEKAFLSGLYLVSFRDGAQVKVKGPDGLEIGAPVRVFRSPVVPSLATPEGAIANAWLLESEAVLTLTAVFPLAFGGKDAKGKIEIYTPKEKGPACKKKVVYFIITLTTERFGDLQWSIHLWGRNAEVQLYGGLKGKESDIHELVRNVEVSFRRAGIRLTGYVNRLEEPFHVPQGFRLDWRA